MELQDEVTSLVERGWDFDRILCMDMLSFRSLIDSSDRIASRKYIEKAVLLRAAPAADKKQWGSLINPHIEKIDPGYDESKRPGVPGINEFLISQKVRKK